MCRQHDSKASEPEAPIEVTQCFFQRSARAADGSGDAAREQFDRLRLAAEANPEAVMVTDTRGWIKYVNPAFEAMTGYRHDEVLGQSAGIVKSGLHGAGFYAGMWSALSAGREFRALFVNRKKNGDIFQEEKTIRPFIGEHGIATHFVSTGRDISERIEILLNLEHQAYYDSLTGLPNRQLFMDRLGQAVVRASRRGGNFTLLCIDLDEFKAVNDAFGHAVGDDMLRTVAVRLTQCVREEDTVARLGGDEFFIILADIGRRDDIEKVAEKIQRAFSHGARYEDRHIPIRASIGAGIFPIAGENEDVLMKHADMAMYARKAAGGSGCSFFPEEQAWPIGAEQQALPLACPVNAFGAAP